MTEIVKNKKKVQDFTKGSIYKKIFLFSVPLLLSNLLQQIYFIADSIIVGRLIGSEALAAVGAATSITALMIFFFQGVASGAGILISQFIGANDHSKIPKTIKAASIFTVVFGLGFSLLGFLLTRQILGWISTPANVFHQTYLYLAIVFLGMLPMLFYNMGAAILQAMGDSRTPLYYLMVGTVINILLDIVFVKFVGMGVEGTAVATVIAQLVAAVMVLSKVRQREKVWEDSAKTKDRELLKYLFKQILVVGLPIGVQAIVIHFSGVVIQNHINGLGSTAMAAWGVFCRIDTFAILPFVSFGTAVMTFVGQNYGAGNINRIFKGVRGTLFMAMGITAIISIIIIFTAGSIFSVFTTEQGVIDYACDMVYKMMPWYFIMAAGQVYGRGISGTGNSMVPMIINIAFMCVMRVILIPVFSINLGHNMWALYYTYYLSWILSTVAQGGYYYIITKKKLKKLEIEPA